MFPVVEVPLAGKLNEPASDDPVVKDIASVAFYRIIDRVVL
jgi:hypothetical protein